MANTVVIGVTFVDIKGFPYARYDPAGRNLGSVKVVHGGVLTGRKSIALPGVTFRTPTLTEQDRRNIRLMKEFGVAA